MNVAIKGHPKRGNEVIEILEMLGGKYEDVYKGTDVNWVYIINEEGFIDWDYPCDKYKVFSLEEFLEKFPYKVGDKVSSKYLKNYKIEKMEWDATNNKVIYKLQGMGWYNTNELQPYKEETMEDKLEQITFDIPNGYEFFGINDDNQVVLAKKQPKYPKTYEECCKVLGYSGNYNMILTTDIDCKLFNALYRLKVCRDAYWKIAGDWKPDFLNPTKEIRYFLFCTGTTIENGQGLFPTNKILIFPTEEMRNKFYENFKDLIEQCKELL